MNHVVKIQINSASASVIAAPDDSEDASELERQLFLRCGRAVVSQQQGSDTSPESEPKVPVHDVGSALRAVFVDLQQALDSSHGNAQLNRLASGKSIGAESLAQRLLETQNVKRIPQATRALLAAFVCAMFLCEEILSSGEPGHLSPADTFELSMHDAQRAVSDCIKACGSPTAILEEIRLEVYSRAWVCRRFWNMVLCSVFCR
jgi:hypothetical protein